MKLYQDNQELAVALGAYKLSVKMWALQSPQGKYFS